jgi:hypothetical protein
MYRQWKQKFGHDDADTLVWLAPSARMNPKLPQHIVDTALATDSARALAEYLCQWRSDLSDFIPHDVVEAATDVGVYERAPMRNVQYFAHADAAGGTGTDSFALAISHREASYVVDAVREYKPRFIPAAVIVELAALVKSYGISKVYGDKYAIGFHSAEWQSHGITFEPCETSTSENYLSILPLMLAGRVRLVDNKTLRHQLGALERKPGEAAREQVSHPQHANAHDDLSCATAGAIVAAVGRRKGEYPVSTWVAAFGDMPQPRVGHPVPGTVDIGSGGYVVPSLERQLQMALSGAQHPTHAQITAEFARQAKYGEKP